MELVCSVNGRQVVRDLAPQELLLDFLRDSLGLTGAKRSCDVQVCGTCTVLVDGLPVSSCCYLAADAHGKKRHDDRRVSPSGPSSSDSRTPSLGTPRCSAASARRACC